MKKKFNFLGMEFNTKNTLLTLAAFAGLLILLVALQLLYGFERWYGFLIGMGFIIAIIFSSKLAKHRGLDKEFPFEIIYLVLPFSIIGARAYYVIFEQLPFFWDAFRIWDGGLAIYGGVIGGAIGGIIYCLFKKQSILGTADVIAPVLLLGQAIGRWGNFANNEVYGFTVNDPAWQWFPFAVPISSGAEVKWHLATFFYESMFDFLGFFLLIVLLLKVKKHKGIVACVYLVYYGIVRYFLEGLRIPGYILFIPGTDFPVSQLVSLIVIALGIIGIVTILFLNKKKVKS